MILHNAVLHVHHVHGEHTHDNHSHGEVEVAIAAHHHHDHNHSHDHHTPHEQDQEEDEQSFFLTLLLKGHAHSFHTHEYATLLSFDSQIAKLKFKSSAIKLYIEGFWDHPIDTGEKKFITHEVSFDQQTFLSPYAQRGPPTLG